MQIFFHNRLYAIIEKIELIEEEENQNQTIENDKKKTDNHNTIQQILTMKDHKEQRDKKK